MSWNYRVIRNVDGLRIFDVYYNEEGQPVGSNVAPTYVYGETVDALKAQLALMLEALEHPILEERDVGSQAGQNVKD